MANAGNHNDTRILKQMIWEGKLIKVFPHDNAVVCKIKLRFNNLVINDHESTHSYLGKKYTSHSAWNKMNNVLRWVNQLRWKHFYFEPLSFSDIYRPKM